MMVFCGALKDDYKPIADEILELMRVEEQVEQESAESDTASSAPAALNNLKPPPSKSPVKSLQSGQHKSGGQGSYRSKEGKNSKSKDL